MVCRLVSVGQSLSLRPVVGLSRLPSQSLSPTWTFLFVVGFAPMVEFDTTRAKLRSIPFGMMSKFQRSPAGGIGVVCFLVCTGFGELSVLDIYMLSRTFKVVRQGIAPCSVQGVLVSWFQFMHFLRPHECNNLNPPYSRLWPPYHEKRQGGAGRKSICQ